jgi:hypothetical protein
VHEKNLHVIMKEGSLYKDCSATAKLVHTAVPQLEEVGSRT